MQWFLLQIYSLETPPDKHMSRRNFDQSPCVSSPKAALTLNQECGGLDCVPSLYMLVFVIFWLVCVCLSDIRGSVVVMCQSMTSWCVMRGSWLLCVGIRSNPLLWVKEEDAFYKYIKNTPSTTL